MGAGPRGCYGPQLLGFSQEKTPCVATLHRVFKDLDVAAFEAEVGNWLANSGVEADDPLSLDGKTLRGVHGQEIPGVHVGAQNYQRHFPFQLHQQLIGVLMVQPQFDLLLGQPLDFPLDSIQEFIMGLP